MTIPFKEPIKYYFKDSFYWMVGEVDLIQFTENFFNEWKPGTDMYGYKRRELSEMKTLDDRQGEYVWDLLENRMRALRMKKEAV